MRMLALVFLGLCAPSTLADASKDWKTEDKVLHKAERRYWKGFKTAFKDAYGEWWSSQDTQANNPQYNFGAFRLLYEDYAAIQAEYGKNDIRLGGSGHPKAYSILLKELDEVVKRIEQTDGELRKGKVVVRDIFGQRPAVESYGLWRRRDLLVEALAQGDLAMEFLSGEGWEAALKKDGRRSTKRRVAVLDAIARTGGSDAARKFLWANLAPDQPVAVRTAAVLAMLKCDGDPKDAIDDPARAVRRTLVQHVSKPRWIGPLVTRLARARGGFRADIVKALGRLTNQTFGDNPAAWTEWLEDYRDEIKKGSFDLKNVEVREAKPRPIASAGSFYGTPLESAGTLFVIDGSWRVHTPASVKAQLKKRNFRWRQEIAQWADTNYSHKRILRREFGRAAATFPSEFKFGFVSLYGSTQIGEKRIAAASKKSIRAADRFLEKLAADGWTSPHVGLLHTADIADKDPDIDTIVMFSGGRPAGGPFVYAKAAVDDWRRRNRARGLTVHTVRIVDDGDEADAYMKGLAEVSTGRYLWAKEPPSLRK